MYSNSWNTPARLRPQDIDRLSEQFPQGEDGLGAPASEGSKPGLPSVDGKKSVEAARGS